MSKEVTLDLDNKQYSMIELRNNIYMVGLFHILRTQKLTEEFVINYVLNKKFQMTDDEEKITVQYVLEMQPHLDIDKLSQLFIVGPTDDDFPNFEKYAETGEY
jgi:hypothetical protein